MPEQRSIIDYINDILDAISKAENFVGNMTFEEFENDEKTLFATVRAFEIIGEASAHIPESLREKYNEIQWKRMVGMRNVLIHRYFGITKHALWNTIKNRFPGLKNQLKEILVKEKRKEVENPSDDE